MELLFLGYHLSTCGKNFGWGLLCTTAGLGCPECLMGMYGIFAIGCYFETQYKPQREIQHETQYKSQYEIQYKTQEK